MKVDRDAALPSLRTFAERLPVLVADERGSIDFHGAAAADLLDRAFDVIG